MNSIFSDDESPTQQTQQPDAENVAKTKRGANWFYWIAALSLINSAIYVFGGNLSFIAGLAVTQIVDAVSDVAISYGLPSVFKAVAVVIDLAAAGLFVFFGYYAGRGSSSTFVAGITIYAIDAVLCLLIGSYFSAAFHGYALFSIVGGLLASRRLKEFQTATA